MAGLILYANFCLRRIVTKFPLWSIYYDQGHESALVVAASRGYHECVSILVANGADVNAYAKYVSTWMVCQAKSPLI